MSGQIKYDDYFERLVHLRLQFDLARKALEGFSGSGEALDAYAKADLEETRELVKEACKNAGKDPSTTWVYRQEEVAKYLEAAKLHVPKRLPDVYNRLNQNEIILQVAIFESFMKDVHRTILRQNPALLRADRKIDLGRLVEKGEKALLEEEIEREVQTLDRKSWAERYKYFVHCLGIDWFEGTIVPLLDDVSEMRNKILHEDPNLQVSDMDVGLMHLVTTSLPATIVAQAAVLYPTAFARLWNIKDDAVRRHMLPKAKPSQHGG